MSHLSVYSAMLDTGADMKAETAPNPREHADFHKETKNPARRMDRYMVCVVGEGDGANRSSVTG